MRQAMQETLYETADAGDTLSDSVSCISCLIECFLNPLSYRLSPASAVL